LSDVATNATGACFRMGVTSIEQAKIRKGVEQLAKLIRELAGSQKITLDESTLNPLSHEQLNQQLSCATLICKTVYGAPCTINLCKDGKMTGVAGHENEEADSGHWWIVGDRWFRQWRKWSYGEQEGYFVTLNHREDLQPNEISWFNKKGRLIDTAEIQLAPPDSQKLA